MQKNIIIIGIIIIIIGTFWPLITYLRLGNLPGDIVIKKNNFTFYFPIMTSLIISLACILISYFFKKDVYHRYDLLSEKLALEFRGFYFNHLANQSLISLYINLLFSPFRTQWFSSGNTISLLGIFSL